MRAMIRARPGPRSLAAARPATALFVLLAVACGPESASPSAPTIVLVTLDTTRAAQLATYGYERPTDPFLSTFAEESLVYDVAISPATWTLPAHVSLFSGVDPSVHGCWTRETTLDGATSVPMLSDDLPLFTGALREADYHLIGAAGGPFTSARYGFARDFDAYVDPDENFELSGEELNAWVFEQLDERPTDQPLFLFVNYFDAHAPYDAPDDRDYPFPEGVGDLEPVPELSASTEPEVAARAIDQYDRELLVQDEALAALIARLRADDLLDDALVIITSDHGEMFGEQPDTFGHGCSPYEPVAHVPLVVQRTPDGPTGRHAAPVSTNNVARTILVAAGLETLPAGGGQERFDLLEPPLRTPPPFVENRSPEEWIGALRGARYKYATVLGPENAETAGLELVFDLETNPAEAFDEIVPLDGFARLDEYRDAMNELLMGWQEPPRAQPHAVLTDEETERLRALGYF